MTSTRKLKQGIIHMTIIWAKIHKERRKKEKSFNGKDNLKVADDTDLIVQETTLTKC